MSMRAALILFAFGLVSCTPIPNACGPTSGVVKRVIDGDTVELETGERVRYLLVDTPELHPAQVCYAEEAKEYNEALVAGRTISLSYDAECKDKYGRLLAYVDVGGTEVNSALIDAGMACVLVIPPNGALREVEFKARQARAALQERGLWGACERSPCGSAH